MFFPYSVGSSAWPLHQAVLGLFLVRILLRPQTKSMFLGSFGLFTIKNSLSVIRLLSKLMEMTRIRSSDELVRESWAFTGQSTSPLKQRAKNERVQPWITYCNGRRKKAWENAFISVEIRESTDHPGPSPPSGWCTRCMSTDIGGVVSPWWELEQKPLQFYGTWGGGRGWGGRAKSGKALGLSQSGEKWLCFSRKPTLSFVLTDWWGWPEILDASQTLVLIQVAMFVLNSSREIRVWQVLSASGGGVNVHPHIQPPGGLLVTCPICFQMKVS